MLIHLFCQCLLCEYCALLIIEFCTIILVTIAHSQYLTNFIIRQSHSITTTATLREESSQTNVILQYKLLASILMQFVV